MLVDAWTPGFIPDLLKAGQVMLCITTGLLLGHIAKSSGAVTGIKQALISAPMLYIASSIIGAMIIVIGFTPDGPAYLTETVFFFTILSGGALAANIKNKRLIIGLTCLSCTLLGASSVPSLGILPDALFVVMVNIIGLVFATSGAALLSHWIVFNQAQFWPKIGTRITGAWFLAIALMMLAFTQSNALI
jgi:hypothetical protein